ncbi:hypothetical protein [Moorena sp. SIO4G3]|uniref:hypothetical protein n=1 Tax=Moorena sp. SIO4G3 TaxID=2607821 RepID=UPI00142C09C3|nr:hypothetical protein [Moorena sp. SIO4G3]NEO80013.1 hypothetical protein [Moorena sp. SIO4G3]
MSAQKAKLLSFFDRKAGTFRDQKRLKPLSVNALIVNQQALDIALRIKVKTFIKVVKAIIISYCLLPIAYCLLPCA